MRAKRRCSTSSSHSNQSKFAKNYVENDDIYVLTGSSKKDPNGVHYTCLIREFGWSKAKNLLGIPSRDLAIFFYFFSFFF